LVITAESFDCHLLGNRRSLFVIFCIARSRLFDRRAACCVGWSTQLSRSMVICWAIDDRCLLFSASLDRVSLIGVQRAVLVGQHS
jgi:hypothetical protein